MKQEVWDYLDEILEQEGALVASNLVERGKDPACVLHDVFQWDDEQAGYQWRLVQARGLCRQYNVRVIEREQKLIHVPAIKMENAPKEGQYKRMGVVVRREDELQRALTETTALLRATRATVDDLQAVVQAIPKKGKRAQHRANCLARINEGLDQAADAVDQFH